LQGTQKSSGPTPKGGPNTPAKAIPIQIDLMHLKIGKVVYVDYAGESPLVKEFRINLDQNYQNITDLNSVVRLIVLKAMMSSGISNLVNLDIGVLEGTLTGAFNTSTKLAAQAAAKSMDALTAAAENPGQVAGQAGGMFKGTTGTVENAAKEVVSGVKNAASSLKKLNPFGKSE
jgi:hypothetical protein